MSDQGSVERQIQGDDARGVLRRGMRVGAYEIVSILGQGSFGITYRARDAANDRDVAIKEYFPASLALREADSTVLPRSTDVAEEFVWGRDRFVEEERTLAKLSGAPAVIRVLDFIESYGTAYMVMALVEGETLDLKLKRDGRLPEAEVERLLGPLMDGLEQVHAAGILHRDIKPGNIIVDAEGLPTLIDFGAARAAMVGRTQTLTAVFTPGYAPIEQFMSRKQGPYTDIYALGATLYQCVTGKVPLGAIDRMAGDEMMPAAQAGRGNYDPKLLTGIDAALITEAAERPQNIAQWREVFASGIGPDTQATRVLPRRAAERTRRRLVWAGLAAAAVLALVGGGYFALNPAQPPGPTAADVETRQKAEAEATARRAEEEQRRAALEARVTEAEAARKAVEEDRTRLQEAEKARLEAQRKAEEEARLKAEQEARQKAAEEAQRVADANDKKKAEAVETALRLSVVDRQHIQVALTSLGFNTGGTDGAFGQRSREMIAGWQKARNQPATGFFTAPQQQALLKEATAAITKYDEEQKKIEDDKKKEEEAKKKAEEEAKAKTAAAPATGSPQATAATSAPSTSPQGSSDGTWEGTYVCGPSPYNSRDNFAQPFTIKISNGKGRAGEIGSAGGGAGMIEVAVNGGTALISRSFGRTNQGQTSGGLVTAKLNGVFAGNMISANGRELGSDMYSRDCVVSLTRK